MAENFEVNMDVLFVFPEPELSPSTAKTSSTPMAK